jgi:hypothetical protein
MGKDKFHREFHLNSLFLAANLGLQEDRVKAEPRKLLPSLVSPALAFVSPNLLTTCTPDTCSNRGICVDHWTTPACDCDLTSFTGPNCTDGIGK